MSDHEIIELIAEKVCGFKVDPTWRNWNPLHDIKAAFQIVKHMRSHGYWMKCCTPWSDDLDDKYSVGFMPFGTVDCGSSWVQAGESTLERAICMAAYEWAKRQK